MSLAEGFALLEKLLSPQTLDWLSTLGYTCFRQGNRGALAQASGGCWIAAFQERISHRWSNLVCSHRADVLAEFWTYARQGAASS